MIRGYALVWMNDLELAVQSCQASYGDVTDFAKIQDLSFAGRHQECLLACHSTLEINPEELSNILASLSEADGRQ